MGELAKALQAEIQQVEGDKVLVPRTVWDSLLEAVEDYGLLKALEEAERTALISKGEALEYLEELERSRSAAPSGESRCLEGDGSRWKQH